MLDSRLKYVCDAESPKGKWCKNPATWEIQGTYGTMHYCEKCKPERETNTQRYFSPAPGAKWERIYG